MIRALITAPLLALVLAVAAPPAAGPGFGPALAADTMEGKTRCMQNCIRSQGGNTLKNQKFCGKRCDVPVATGSDDGSSGFSKKCMSRYKACEAKCANVTCLSTCKQKLMVCKK